MKLFISNKNKFRLLVWGLFSPKIIDCSVGLKWHDTVYSMLDGFPTKIFGLFTFPENMD